MKQYRFLLIVLLTIFLLFGCAGQTQSEVTRETKDQPETVETSPTEVAEEKISDMEEEVFALGFVTADSIDSNTPCQIRTRKYRKDHPDYTCYTLYIEVDTGLQVLKMELEPETSPSPGGCGVLFGDVDGDGIQEILVHHNTGGVGGFGIWQTWVLKVENNALRILFENSNEFDTGFECRFVEGYQLEIKNNITGYTLVYDVKDRYGAYIDGSSELSNIHFMIDPFYVFEPKDVDDDGISEILCKQYTSICSHADYTGTACSTLKFNNKLQAFEVIDAWYEPNTEE